MLPDASRRENSSCRKTSNSDSTNACFMIFAYVKTGIPLTTAAADLRHRLLCRDRLLAWRAAAPITCRDFVSGHAGERNTSKKSAKFRRLLELGALGRSGISGQPGFADAADPFVQPLAQEKDIAIASHTQEHPSLSAMRAAFRVQNDGRVARKPLPCDVVQGRMAGSRYVKLLILALRTQVEYLEFRVARHNPLGEFDRGDMVAFRVHFHREFSHRH